MINAGSFTVAPGIFHGREHIYVTHPETGKQWVSKSPSAEKHDLDVTVDFIKTKTIVFDPHSRIRSCDTRFWMSIRDLEPLTRSDFDALCFIGD
jgi:hypothetical protein